MTDSAGNTGVTKRRSVWKNNQGSCLLNVSGLLEAGEYSIEKTVRDDGTIVLEFELIESGD